MRGSLLESHVYRALPDLVRAEAITNRLRTAVTLGVLEPGDRLPNELEMAESFGVAAATLREALGQLRDEGVVTTRRGRNGGTFIVDAPRTGREVLERRLVSSTVAELRDLGDEHSAIATAAVRLAADRAGDADLDRLDELGGRLAKAADPRACARADSRFHIQIAVIAQSRRLTLQEMRLQDEIAELLWAPLATQFDQRVAADGHAKLVAALRARDPELAASLMRQSIRRSAYHLIDTRVTLSYGDAVPFEGA